jgi:hypothetical protein
MTDNRQQTNTMASTIDQAEFVSAKVRSQQSATLVQLGALTGAIVCLALAAMLQAPINQQRKDLQLVLQSNLYKELPPKYAWVSAAGGTFRGIAADILWMRAEGMKEQGKYYEMHQLAKWICTLQPRFAAVWTFQSWNMAYNISVATHTALERWQWVYNGIRLLRDEGIPNNERTTGLYYQLAWTWFHKVGDRLDDYHMKYKRIWATTMDCLLGPPPVTLSEDEQVNWIKPIADAPRTLDALIAQRPGVRKLVEQLKAINVDVDAETSVMQQFHPLELTFFKPYAKSQVEQAFARYRKGSGEVDEHARKVGAFVQAAPPEDMQALLAYLRGKVLREQYKMDPQFMQDMTGMLGTEKPIFIDWRTPWSQAMYWAKYGAAKAEQLQKASEFDTLNTDRVQLFSLGNLARQGQYIFRPNLDSPEDSFLDMSPDWRYVEAMHQMCLRLGKKHADEGEKIGDTAGENLKDYHVNTLHSAILGLYFSGREEQANKYFLYLAQNYKDQFTGETKEMYLGSFQEFLQKQIKEMAGSQQEAILLIHSLLESALMSLANGQMNECLARVRNARNLYDSYQGNIADDPAARRSLPPWEQILADGLGRFVTSPGLPLALRFAVWERFDVAAGMIGVKEVKQRCYDDVRGAIDQMYAKSDLDIDRAFPPPPGMDEWRKLHPMDTPEAVVKEAVDKKREQEKKKQQGK